MGGPQQGPANAMQLPDRIDHEWLRTQASRPREARIETLANERQDHLSNLFIALRDTPRPYEFEAGLKGRKRRKLAREGQAEVGEDDGAEGFMRRYQDIQNLREIDFSLPPLSPSPPPASPPKPQSTSAPTNDIIPNSEDEGDVDAEGEDEDEEMAVAEALAPGATSSSTAVPTTTSQQPQPQSSAAPPAPSTSAPTIPVSAPSTSAQPPVASTSAATLPPSALPIPSSQPTDKTVAPSLTTSNSDAPSLPNPAPLPVDLVAPPPYTSIFGISSISSDYTDSLPPVPNEILRSRLNTSLALRPNTKKSSKTASTSSSTSLVQPDLYKLHVRAQHMGAQTFLGPGKRIHNALSTHEWDVGMEELKSIRVFERIEQLKAEKKWSFRQPKKQRIGFVPKAHWDHLLDEMRWMHTDYRQETRWKVVTAHRLARACRAYHRASPEIRSTLCVRTRPPRHLNEGGAGAKDGMEVDGESSSTSKGKGKAVVDEDAEAEEDADGETEEAVPTLPGAAITGEPSTSSSVQAPAGAGKAGGTGGDEKSLDPTKGSVSRSQQQQLENAKAQAQAKHIQELINFRSPIFDLATDETIIDHNLLLSLREANAAGELSDEALAVAELDLIALFPDLPLYSDFILAEDVNMSRRIEESSAWNGRLSNVTRLLESKPLLVSTLQPGRTRTREGWIDETASIVEDIEPPVDPRDQLPNTSSVLFAGRKPKDVSAGEVLVKPASVPQPDVRASSILWLPEEDGRLLQLQRQYGLNWPLIAEVFNNSTQRPSSDHRLPWDCFDRWDRLVGPGSRKTLPDGTEIKIPAPDYIPPVDKFGRSVPVLGNGSKKSARHISIIEAMKKVQKQRETTSLKAPPPGFPRRINMSMHESHNLPPRPYWTPMEWSIYKAEQESQKQRMRQAQAQQAAAAAAAQQQQQQNGNQPRYQGQGPIAGNFPNGNQGGQQQRVPSSLPAQMANAAAQIQAQGRGSPNGSPSALSNPNLGSPSPASAQLHNGAGQPMQLQLPNGTPQLSAEQIAQLQNRQQALLAAQAQMRMQQQQLAQQQQGGAGGGQE